jgi:hypothetical protein
MLSEVKGKKFGFMIFTSFGHLDAKKRTRDMK